jgi:hypothetical protein
MTNIFGTVSKFGFDSGMPRMTWEEKNLHFDKFHHKNVMAPLRIEEKLCTKMCLPITLQKFRGIYLLGILALGNAHTLNDLRRLKQSFNTMTLKWYRVG